MKRRNLFILAFIILLGFALFITIRYVQLQQELRSRADKATTISLVPNAATLKQGETKGFDIEVVPSHNVVSFIKLIVTYDPTKIATTEAGFVNKSELVLMQGPIYESGKISLSLSAASDITKVLQEKTTVGEFQFRVLDSATPSQTRIEFKTGANETQALSAGQNEEFAENVLASANGAVITILGNEVCDPNQSTCEWDATSGATSYHYKVTEVDSDTVIKEGDVDASTTKASFPFELGRTYKCEVNAVNKCGEGPVGEATDSCPLPSVSPPPEVTPTPEDTPTPKPSSTPAPSTTPRPSSTPSPTPTVTPTPTMTPTPTITPTPSLSPTPGPSSTPFPTVPPQQVIVVTSPPQTIVVAGPTTIIVQPTIVPTGTVETTIFAAIVGIALTVAGIALFLLF